MSHGAQIGDLYKYLRGDASLSAVDLSETLHVYSLRDPCHVKSDALHVRHSCANLQTDIGEREWCSDLTCFRFKPQRIGWHPFFQY